MKDCKETKSKKNKHTRQSVRVYARVSQHPSPVARAAPTLCAPPTPHHEGSRLKDGESVHPCAPPSRGRTRLDDDDDDVDDDDDDAMRCALDAHTASRRGARPSLAHAHLPRDRSRRDRSGATTIIHVVTICPRDDDAIDGLIARRRRHRDYFFLSRSAVVSVSAPSIASSVAPSVSLSASPTSDNALEVEALRPIDRARRRSPGRAPIAVHPIARFLFESSATHHRFSERVFERRRALDARIRNESFTPINQSSSPSRARRRGRPTGVARVHRSHSIPGRVPPLV